jgi:cold-inducible RNA-binding protein
LDEVISFGERPIMAKLFVGGLPWATTSDDLNALFSQAGAVISASVIQDRMTGRSKGFGFVEMSDEDAKKAAEMFDGSQFGGRSLIVNPARPKEEGDRPQRSGGFRGGHGGHGGHHRGGHRDDNSEM